MLVQQSLFDVNESKVNIVSEKKSLQPSQDDKKAAAVPAPCRRQKHFHWKFVDLVGQMIICFANLYAVIGKTFGMFGPINKDCWTQNLMWTAVSISVMIIVIVLVARNPVLLRKLYRLIASLCIWFGRV